MKFPAPLLLPLLGAALLMSAATVRAEKKQLLPLVGPPIPAPIQAKVSRLAATHITLRVVGIQRSPVTFILRSGATHGQIRFLKQTSNETAEVEYVPPEDASITRDVFRFAARNAAGISAETEAIIQIINNGPQLVLPQTLNFGTLRADETARQNFEVRNSGDEPYSGEVSVPSPWRLIGSPALELAAGAAGNLTLEFPPQNGGSYSGDLKLSGHKGTPVRLKAEVLKWVLAAPDPLELSWRDAASQEASLTLENPGDSELSVAIQSVPRLEHTEMVQVPPRQSISLPFVWRKVSASGGWGTLSFSAPDGRRHTIVWRLDACLSGLGETILLDSSVQHPYTERTLTNSGGRPGKWVLECAAPFSLRYTPQNRAPTTGTSADNAKPSPEATKPKSSAQSETPSLSSTSSGAQVTKPYYYQGRWYAAAPSTPAGVQLPGNNTKPNSKTEQNRENRKPSLLLIQLEPGQSREITIEGVSGAKDSSEALRVVGPGTPAPVALKLESRVRKVYTPFKSPPDSGTFVQSPRIITPKPEMPPSGIPLEETPLPIAQKTPGATASPNPADLRSKSLESIVPSTSKKEDSLPLPSADEMRLLQSNLMPGIILDGFAIRDITKNSATIEFPADEPVKPGDLMVVRRKDISSEDGRARSEWVPLENVSGKRIGRNIQLTLKKLPPQTLLSIRLLGPLEAGNRRMALIQRDFITLPEGDSLWLRGTGATLCLAALFWLLRRRKGY